MAAIHKAGYSFSERRQQFEQNKPSSPALPSFMHRHNSSDGVNLPSSPHSPTLSGNQLQDRHNRPNNHRPPTTASRGSQKLSINTQALGHCQQNAYFASPHSPTKSSRDTIIITTNNNNHNRLDNPGSPTKGGLANLSARFIKDKTPKETSPKKPRPTTNLTGLLSRPRSSKNLGKSAAADQEGKNKENRRPSDPASSPPTPIHAQFCGVGFGQAASVPNSPYDMPLDPFTHNSLLNINNSFRPQASDGFPGLKRRPKSFQPQHSSKPDLLAPMDERRENRGRLKADEPQESPRSSTWAKGRSISRARVLSAISSIGGGQKSKSPTPPLQETNVPQFNPKDIDKHLEALLDRRNIPECQRYKMRNLNDTVKMEFIRQDWAESEGRNLVRPPTNESEDFNVDNSKESVRGTEKKHSRGRSFTFSRNSWKIGGSPSKSKKKDASVKGHTRNKSADSTVSERPPSAGSYSSNGIMAKVTGQQPSDFVNYLRKVQKPESVEVGKLHKLRLLLRNERVAWTEDFIRQGGMKEIVCLLHRILEVEWREEHEDALLHEDLLCLKALCTTALALQYLHSIQDTLFPALLGMIFDPEKKGPSEFTTRNIVTSVLFTYIQRGTPQERVTRARTVLSYLHDPQAKEDERPVDFVLEMRRERPYRVWNKEVVSVTKEVFWIFLHQLNVVALPAGHKSSEDIRSTANNTDTATLSGSNRASSTTAINDPLAYMTRHFPQERQPVPAAPYVGGVEWDATNYLASHLDIMNAIIACTPTKNERNTLREEFRISGWERCLGGSLRLCKEKFYPAVHEALRTWVAAAADDGWDVRDVRYGPPPESRSASPKKAAGGAGGKKKVTEEPPPRLEMPKLDFMLDGPLSAVP
ncbi:GTPase-binding protein rid1 [Cytospora mali]|uniref:GTPase-binding protein rid1 n=1 Tax=Cytospora mali TaxID=578113 RepID=A0A194UVQ6_CYTMA|nr:GTPase-binding protein rid1 [Valsa mali var. pyri (nom. inval.)]